MDPGFTQRKIGQSVDQQKRPYISVVMPVRNEEQTVESVITALLGQEYPQDRFEVIVCDGCSTDRTEAVVRRLAALDRRIKLLRNEGRLSSVGRNLGFHYAQGELILYVDGHCVIPDRQLLAAVAELFETTGASCLCRAQPLIPDDTSGVWAAAIAAVRTSPLGHSRNSYIYSDHEGFVSPVSVGAAYRREVFTRIGEYDESFDAGEDLEFNVRVEKAGLKSYISPRLKVLYYARRELGGLYRQMKRYGRGRYHLLRKHPAAFEWQSMVPPAAVVLTAFVILSILFVPPLRGPLLAGALAAYVAILLLTLPSGGPFGWHGWPLYPLAFLTVYWGLGIGFLRAALGDTIADATRISPSPGTRNKPVR